MKRLIKNGFVVSDMVEIDRPADVLIEDDKIVEVGYDINCEDAEIIDACGMFVYPGFIDMHCTICDPGHESVEDIETALSLIHI